MALIEDYALLGDTHSAALVCKDGSIDWLCLPRFDSPACFAALLDPEAGRWRIAPATEVTETTRAYRPDSMVLETTFVTPEGTVKLTDCLPIEQESDPARPRGIVPEDVVVRIVSGIEGRVPMAMEYAPRYDYGSIVPWLRNDGDAIVAIGGPDSLDLRAEVEMEIKDAAVHSHFEVAEGETRRFIACYHASHEDCDVLRSTEDCERLVEQTDDFWRRWVGSCGYHGAWRDQIVRSLLTLKALTYSPTGGILAAPTTSLPEALGGVRNWDYRYCWLRDATFTLDVLLEHGYIGEAAEWRDWLLRAIAGDPEDLQIMYGVRGERRLTELELPWLRGYENSQPVRVGNGAVEQFQLDVYGEVMDALHSGRREGVAHSEESWELQRHIIDFVCDHWSEPDEGIWEVRSGRKHFVHSKVMAWVALDRAVQAVERFGHEGDLGRWKQTCQDVRDEVMTKGISESRGCFKRAYDEDEVDASLLMLPLVGFIDATEDPMRATIEAVEAELMNEGLVYRYRHEVAEDGLPPGEGSFLLCSFWLVDCLVLLGRADDARELFERLLSLANDVGLLAEQYDIERRRLTGNFPQAFSHIALATAAVALEQAGAARGVRRGR